METDNESKKAPRIKRNTRRVILLVGLILLLVGYWKVLPTPLFETPYSTVLESKSGDLLGAKIADDGQWRFPISEETPYKFEQSIIEFEDRNFHSHFGVDPIAIARALLQNYKAGEVKSGASTLSMQVIRLSKNNPPRTVWEKVKEMVQATRLEISYSKEEIMAMYAAHAPFGGNVVGLEAASWRYFGREPDQLSWAESATLAVLPNSPALIHPGRNRDALKAKRDRLLARLLEESLIDSLTYQLSLLEVLPNQPHALPSEAPHLVANNYLGANKGKKVRSTIDGNLQHRVNEIVQRHYTDLNANGIKNAAVLVLDVKANEVAAYVANTAGEGRRNGHQVDIIQAPRSPGSILKPFLYMMKLNEGDILPKMLVPDVPSRFSDYSPKNYTRTYDGAVSASEALSRSLNVPAVYMLQEYGVPKFHHYLTKLGMTTLTNPPEHYGLSLILGGAEGTLWDITTAYGSLAEMVNNYDPRAGDKGTYQKINFRQSADKPKISTKEFALSEGAVWSTLEAMVEVTRPEDEVFWKRFESSRKVAWKTGTSFGFRDGWAIGVTPEYVIGVWVGNADGEGRPNLTGIKTAGPILFDVFDGLPPTTWFNEPLFEMETIEVCVLSGHRAGEYCDKVESVSVPKSGLKTTVCPYHQRIYVNQEETARVNSSCASVSQMKAKNWFVLPPVEEWYYKKKHGDYKVLPPLSPNCAEEQIASMRLIYPFKASTIYVPLELDGSLGKTIFEVAHRDNTTEIYWHLDEEFIGTTSTFHQMALSPKPGAHTLTLVDENGNTLVHEFVIVGG
ncbi:MAG: penicillin-binding protein 1C [Balneolaceae bacterium]